jgi:hypothetical protein
VWGTGEDSFFIGSFFFQQIHTFIFSCSTKRNIGLVFCFFVKTWDWAGLAHEEHTPFGPLLSLYPNMKYQSQSVGLEIWEMNMTAL